MTALPLILMQGSALIAWTAMKHRMSRSVNIMDRLSYCIQSKIDRCAEYLYEI
jgi:hypothetical protein